MRLSPHRTSKNSTAQLATSTTLLPRQVFFIYISTFLPAHPSIICRYLNLILPLLPSVLASSYHKQQVRVTLFISTLRPAVNHRLPPLALIVLRGFEPRFVPSHGVYFPRFTPRPTLTLVPFFVWPFNSLASLGNSSRPVALGETVRVSVPCRRRRAPEAVPLPLLLPLPMFTSPRPMPR